ncbi:MAG: AAC(3) family N-acetyltransferase [Candidatus Sumerlaeota bacterium]|nr:AAC(3) family N-acetyltransferase [Candidatus Sumerlaeota bacterium]
MMGERAVTREMIADALREAGIRAGESLAVHSSLKSLGFVEGGAEAAICALQDVLTPEGTLMMPTHTYSLPMWGKEPYNKTKSPSLVGKITDVFWRMPDVLRSDHPSHSVAAWGKRAEEFTKDTLPYPPIGLNSAWHRFYSAGGRILMLGTNQGTNTSLHLCEVLADVPYLNVVFTPGRDYEVAHRINERGEVKEFILRQVPGCSRGFRKCEPYLRESNVLKDVIVVNAQSQLLDISSLVEVMVRKLKEDPGFILCEIPDCGICQRRRRII